MSKKNPPIIFFFCMVMLLTPIAVQSCPGCASALSKSLGSAFNMSVLFMMAMPFTLFGAFVLGFILLNRHAQKTPSRAKKASRNQM